MEFRDIKIKAMEIVFRLLFIFFLSFQTATAAPDEDRVTFLPGLEVQPTFNHYAGFLQATGTKSFFYWFIESERDPATDPVVLWLNGGPGCSSLTGLLAELGPWRTLPDGSGLEWFEHRWNKIANIIFMESPQCVGYSYSIDESCTSTDNVTAADNHAALQDFFSKFPEYKTNEFYITGESYAGIYVPTLSARIVDDPEFNFQGFAVGNAVTDDVTMANAYPYFAWARGLIGTELWEDLVDNCCVNGNSSDCEFYKSSNNQCRLAVAQVENVQWRIGLNPYDVYAECYGGAPSKQGLYEYNEHEVTIMLPYGRNRPDDSSYSELLGEYIAKGSNVTVRIPCSYTDDRETYLNRQDVREALHVPSNVQYWLPCSSIGYVKQYVDVRAEYIKVLERGHRVLAYFGDLDMACDHLGGMWFIESLNRPLVESFKQWFYPDDMGFSQIAGFVIQYEQMKFVSVKGAGHFVPTDSPLAAYQMFERFLNNEPY